MLRGDGDGDGDGVSDGVDGAVGQERDGTMTHVVVVGSGIGGLMAALIASERSRVTLITKSRLEESNTRYAQGGVAAAVFPDDSIAEHVADTLRAGAGLNVVEAVEVLCGEGPDRIADLIRFGVEFDRAGGGSTLARGLEAAHSRARVLHAGGDATGAVIERALVAAVREAGVRIVEHTFLADFVVDDGRVVGVELIGPDAEQEQQILADAVILASGGAGQLFLHTTNPSVATGDGAAAAWRAGAVLTDIEFFQFHPTALALPGNFLVSEAVRGEGAVLRGASGSRFMSDIHPDAELAPRDVVARGIANEMAAHGGAPVMLDATALGAEFLARRFPTIDAACRDAGFDWSRQSVPVTPAAHYWMGGVATDTWGRTSLPGLYAVGEVACTGAHGANRLASNSLLESAVLAHRAARVAGGDAAAGELDLVSGLDWVDEARASGAVFDSAVFDSAAFDSAAVDVAAGVIPDGAIPFSRIALQQLLWENAGVHRHAAGLAMAAETLRRWKVGAATSTTHTSSSQPPASISSTGANRTIADREDANLLDLAVLVVDAALVREESRGAHFRSDFPAVSPDFAHHTGWVREVFALC